MSDFGLSSWAEHYFLEQNLLPSCLRGFCRVATTLGGGWKRQNRDQFSARTLVWCGQYVHTWALCPPIQGMLCSIYLYDKYPLPFVRVEESVCQEREWDLRFNCFLSRFNPPSGLWLHLQSACGRTHCSSSHTFRGSIVQDKVLLNSSLVAGPGFGSLGLLN